MVEPNSPNFLGFWISSREHYKYLKLATNQTPSHNQTQLNSTQKLFSLISSALCRDWCVGSEAKPLSFNCTRANANFRVKRGTSFDRSMMWIKSPTVSTGKEMRRDVKWPAINLILFLGSFSGQRRSGVICKLPRKWDPHTIMPTAIYHNFLPLRTANIKFQMGLNAYCIARSSNAKQMMVISGLQRY